MTGRLIWLIMWGSCLGASWAAAEPAPNADPVCVYQSKAYSEGAFLCVQKSLMLKCGADGPRMSWKPVLDRDISDRCTESTVQHYSLEPRFHPRKAHFVVRRPHPMVESPAKCFIFNGTQYCE
jgi:Protein of unknown function (DUF1496)